MISVAAELPPLRSKEIFIPAENEEVLMRKSVGKTIYNRLRRLEPRQVPLIMKSAVSTLPSVADVRAHSSRFGMNSNNSFFSRNIPHTQRVRHIKGLNDKPVCSVNDEGIYPSLRYCLGKPTSTERHLLFQYKLPACLLGINSTLYPIDTITGLQNFPIKEMDFPPQKLLSDAWLEELKILTQKAGLGLIQNKEKKKDETAKTQTQHSPMTGCLIHPPLRPVSRQTNRPATHSSYPECVKPDQELMVLDMLCQILQTDSIVEIQYWLLTAGQREKELVLNMIRATVASELLYQQKHAEEKRLLTAMLENGVATSRERFKSMKDSEKRDDANERPRTATPQPSRPARSLQSPTKICHLNLYHKIGVPHSKPKPSFPDWTLQKQASENTELASP